MYPETEAYVAIVEDNTGLGESLAQIVESGPSLRCAGVWRTGEEALKKIEAFRPDVVLMDIHLPGISGIDVTAKVKQQMPEIEVVMVTVYGDHDRIFAALQAGASGYLLKRSSPAEVRDAIHDVLTGGAPMSAEIARRVVEAFHRRQKSETDPDDALSPREVEVLDQVCKGLTNKEIGGVLGIAADTVRVHLRNIYEKLHVRSRTEAAMKFRNSRERNSL